VIQRAKAFEMNPIVWSRSMTPARAREFDAQFGGNDRKGLLAMLPECDAVTVHVAGTPETEKLCDAEFFNAMRDGAYFINTSRGSVVDEIALADAVKWKKLRCGLDVYRNQPGASEADWTSPLASLPGVYCTHHSGASTEQAQSAVAEEVVRIVQVYRDAHEFRNMVN
jgi:D-3-phosphoglycerate dehydrogenase